MAGYARRVVSLARGDKASSRLNQSMYAALESLVSESTQYTNRAEIGRFRRPPDAAIGERRSFPTFGGRPQYEAAIRDGLYVAIEPGAGPDASGGSS